MYSQHYDKFYIKKKSLFTVIHGERTCVCLPVMHYLKEPQETFYAVLK